MCTCTVAFKRDAIAFEAQLAGLRFFSCSPAEDGFSCYTCQPNPCELALARLLDSVVQTTVQVGFAISMNRVGCFEVCMQALTLECL